MGVLKPSGRAALHLKLTAALKSIRSWVYTSICELMEVRFFYQDAGSALRGISRPVKFEESVLAGFLTKARNCAHPAELFADTEFAEDCVEDVFI